MMNTNTPKRLTVGMRARIKTLKELPSRDGKPGHFDNESSWRKSYGSREVLLVERTTNGDFSVYLLGTKLLKKRNSKTVENRMAWVPESDLVFVDADFETNLDFIDWYQNHEDEFCGDCGAWFPKNGIHGEVCPNKKCPGRLYDSGLCPSCKTPEGKGRYCKKCGFDWELRW
jgi:hypothetical protein